jgi:hypothetical protein
MNDFVAKPVRISDLQACLSRLPAETMGGVGRGAAAE